MFEAPTSPESPVSGPLDDVPDIVYRIRLHPTVVIEYVSPSSAEIVGYSPGEYYADPLLASRRVHPDDLPILQAALADPRGDAVYLIRYRHRDDHVVLTEHRLRPIRDSGGRLVAVVGVARPAASRFPGRVVAAGDLTLDLTASRASLDGRTVELTVSEHRILAVLATHDRDVDRRELVEHLWGSYHASGERAVEVHISNLRRKLETDPHHPVHLITVRGVGYRLTRDSLKML